jgi:hypothetical protein
MKKIEYYFGYYGATTSPIWAGLILLQFHSIPIIFSNIILESGVLATTSATISKLSHWFPHNVICKRLRWL